MTNNRPNVAKAEAYVQGVLDGSIPACRWIKLACQRHVNDLKRAADGWRWVFDPAKAEKPCRTIELLPHTKGKWAQKGELIRLEGWQAFAECSVFGWVDRETGLRRFLEADIFVPRKNGKSAISAGTGLHMLRFDGEHGAEVYCNATSEAQAWEVFAPAKYMVNNNEALKKMGVIANASSIIVPSTSSQFKPVIGKPGDGSSPSMSVIDEYHEHATSDAYDTMLSGMGARQQPLMWVITTAGDNLAGPCYAKQLYIQDILTGAIEDERTFGLIYTIDPEDDWTSPEALRKANPNLDVSVNSEFLLNEQAKAIRNPRDQGRFKTKHLNIWVNSRSAYFNLESWAKCPPAPPLESLRGQRCWIALDLASKVDIAALEMLFPLGDGHYARYGKSYLPEATVEDPKNAHYQQWRDEGFLEVTDGNIIDFGRIEEDVLDLCEMFEVTDVSYDPFQGNYLAIRLQDQGVSTVEYKQTVERLSDPMKTLDAWIQAGLLHHNCGPSHPFTWQLSNVVAKADRKDNVFPTKEREEKKIDNPVAQMMCVGRAIEGRPSGESVYEGKELFVL